jgi:hypothetical protein
MFSFSRSSRTVFGMTIKPLSRYVDKRRLAQQAAPAERAPGFCFDALLVVKRAERLLLKARMKLDLIHRGRDARLAYDPFEVIAIEIRDADRMNPSILLQTNERLPAFDIAVDAWARPVDQVQIERVAAKLFDARVKCAHRFVEAVIRIAKFRRHKDVSAAEQSLADTLLVSIHRSRIDKAIAFVDRHFDHPLRLIGRRLEDAKPKLRHGCAAIEGDSRLGSACQSSPRPRQIGANRDDHDWRSLRQTRRDCAFFKTSFNHLPW